MSEHKITCTLDVNQPQLDSLRELSKIEPGWHFCNLKVRVNGQWREFEADWVRDICEAVRRYMPN